MLDGSATCVQKSIATAFWALRRFGSGNFSARSNLPGWYLPNQNIPPQGAAARNFLSPLVDNDTDDDTTLPALSSSITTQQMFAVVQVKDFQYKVSPGDVLALPRLRCEIGSEIALTSVLMCGGERFTAIGRPLLENCRVVAVVEEQKRMKPITTVFYPKKKKVTDWKEDHRPATIVRVLSVSYDPVVVGEIDKYQGNLLPIDVAIGAVGGEKGGSSRDELKDNPNWRYWQDSEDMSLENPSKGMPSLPRTASSFPGSMRRTEDDEE